MPPCRPPCGSLSSRHTATNQNTKRAEGQTRKSPYMEQGQDWLQLLPLLSPKSVQHTFCLPGSRVQPALKTGHSKGSQPLPPPAGSLGHTGRKATGILASWFDYLVATDLPDRFGLLKPRKEVFPNKEKEI